MTIRLSGAALTVASLIFIPATSFAQDAQSITAPKGLGIWLVGTHPMAEDPSKQVVAHHFC
jgi:hypothetical protein